MPGVKQLKRPPRESIGAIEWARKNLFSNWFNSILTLLSIYLIAITIPPLIDWALLSADWVGSSRNDCSGNGACWVFVYNRFSQFVYGFYPEAERWRANIIFVLFFSTIGLWLFKKTPFKKTLAVWSVLVFPLFAWFFLSGGFAGLEKVDTSQWGGMFLTVLVSSVGIISSLPLGILLALGRRSNLPVIKTFSVIFIEFWRGVPLITVLFMSSVMLPLFLPEGVNFDKLLRALIGIALFSSAYMAEVVRGGLQAIPKGQYEAAKALGLNYYKSMSLIILPQALKHVIPGIVNTFIGLFKDTTLVTIIGMFDLLGIIQAAVNDPDWLEFVTEGYVFAALFFWIFCFSMSKYSRSIEKSLQRGH